MESPQTISDIRHALARAEGADLAALVVRHTHDRRAGVTQAVAVAARRLLREAREDERLVELCAMERALADRGIASVAGIDEVGRGALAGPVTAAAVVLPDDFAPRGLIDSKQLDPVARTRFDALIRENAIAFSVSHVSPEVIDAIGIARATAEAMRDAIATLGVPINHVLVDGLPVELGYPLTAVVKGDVRVRCIAAASIIAKVARDALMVDLGATIPGYSLEENKGYGSPGHLLALKERGPSNAHRRSFSPCSQTHLF